jgi:hypothetical protein
MSRQICASPVFTASVRFHAYALMEELLEIIRKNELQAELMLAHYFNGKPQLFKVDLAIGRADKESSHFSSFGSGANLGEYLLCEHTKPDMNLGLVSILAGYIIETVCQHDCTCGLPAKVGAIIDDVTAVGGSPNPERIHPTAIGASLIVIEMVDSNSSPNKLLSKMIDSERQRRYGRIERLLEAKRKENLKQFNELVQNPTAKRKLKVGKTFRNIILVEAFYIRSLIREPRC